VTLPKSSFALPRTRVPTCWPELDSLNRIQPVRVARADNASTRPAAFPIRAIVGFLSGWFRITCTNGVPPLVA
jgi:hypothetical protein